MRDDEDDIQFMWACRDQIEALLADGWRPCAGWENAGHHLRYAFPMWRPYET